MTDPIEILEDVGRWRTRDVRYMTGSWEALKPEIPRFQLEEFKSVADGPSNPFLKTVVRLPRTDFERLVPVGTVSPSYSLAQHTDVVEKCFEGIRESGVDPDELKCEVGLTELAEWMNFCAFFPESFDHTPRRDNEKLALRLECFNSVDGSSRLTIFFGWFRFVCSNGLIIGETKAELKDTHDRNLDLNQIPGIIKRGMELADGDRKRLGKWDAKEFDPAQLARWVNRDLTKKWGKKAAARVYHLCEKGCEVDFPLPFAPGEATEKPVDDGPVVPGAANPAKSFYDVSQALSWVATKRKNPDERVLWQTQIPKLIESLPVSP